MIINIIGRMSNVSKIIIIGLLGVSLGIIFSIQSEFTLILMSILAMSTLLILIFRLRVIDIVVILLPVSFYIQLGVTFNTSLADFLLPVLFLILFAKKYRSEKAKSKQIFVYAFLLILVVSLSLASSIFYYQPNVTNGVSNIFKFIVNMVYLYLFYAFFKYDLKQDNFRLLKIWSHTSVIVSIIGIAGVFLISKGINIGVTFATRAKGTFEDPNLFAAYLILSFGITLIYNDLFKKRLIGLNVIIILTALLFTYSRGGIVAVLVGLLLVFLINLKVKNMIKLVVLSAFVVFVLSPIMQYIFTNNDTNLVANAITRVSNAGLDDGSASLRIYLWDTALNLWKQNPIIGVGTGQFISSAYSELNTLVLNIPHNTYLTFLAETGLLGFLCFLWLPLYAFWKVFLSAKRGNRLSSFLLIGLIAIAIQAFTINLENFRMFWVFLAFCMVWIEREREKAVG